MAHHDHGIPMDDIAEQYRWDEALIGALIAFGEAHRAGVGASGRAPPARSNDRSAVFGLDGRTARTTASGLIE